MSFLGGALKDVTAASRVEQAIRADLELRRKRGQADERFSGYVYRGTGALLLEHGRFFSGRQIPAEFEHLIGPQTHCFQNALLAVEADPRLAYWTGVYCTGFGPPRLHSWCIAPDGGVVEVTMPTDPDVLAGARTSHGTSWLAPDHWGYFGLRLQPELVCEHAATFGDYAFMDRAVDEGREALRHGGDPENYSDPDRDFPLLMVPYDVNRKTLP